MDVEPVDRPFCKVCFKTLPPGFEGFNECVFCYYQMTLRVSYHGAARLPSYRTAYHLEPSRE